MCKWCWILFVKPCKNMASHSGCYEITIAMTHSMFLCRQPHSRIEMAVLKWCYGCPIVSPQLAEDMDAQPRHIMLYTEIAWISVGTVQWFNHECLHIQCGGTMGILNTCYQGSPADSWFWAISLRTIFDSPHLHIISNKFTTSSGHSVKLYFFSFTKGCFLTGKVSQW